MDYPRLHEQSKGRLKRVETQIKNLRERIEEALGIAERHETKGKKELYKKKVKSIEGFRKKEATLLTDIEQLKAEIKAIAGYNPLNRQSRRINGRTSQYYHAGSKFWSIRNSRWKVFQDIFSPSQYRIRPKRKGSIVLKTPYDDLSLDPCVVDPDRISDAFLREFEMPMPEKDLSVLEKMRFKEEAIPAVKEFFHDHVTPMLKFSQKGIDKNWRLLIVHSYGSEHDGKIIHPRYVSGESEGQKPRKVMQFFDSAYATCRKTEHVDRRYKAETRLIIGMEADLVAIHKRILNLQGGDKPEEELDAIKQELQEKLTMLQGSINLHKRSAQHDLEKVAQLRDRLNRENLGASLARLLKILRHLKTRTSEVFTTSLASPEDAKTLEDVIDRSEKTLDQFSRALEALLRTGNVRSLRSLDSLASLRVRPFNLYATHLQEAIDVIEMGSRSKDRLAMTKEAFKALAAAKLFNVEREREVILCEVSAMSVEPGLESLLEFGRQLYRVINANQVRAHQTVFDVIKQNLKTLADELKQMEKNEKAPEELYQTFKRGLKGIDFGALLDQLN